MYTAVTVLTLLLVSTAIATTRNAHDDEDLLPGWLGTDHNPEVVEPDYMAHRESRMKVLDADARIFLYEKFLTPEECKHIVQLSKTHLERSGVVEARSGGSEISQIRTSSGVFLMRSQDEVIQRVEKRIAAWTLLPVGNGEGLQVLRYQKEQKYDAHWDYFFHKEGTANGGNRYATVLMYLTDVEEGGETVFPNIPAPGGENIGFSECAKHHLAAKPRQGDAILFHSIKPTGELERKSLHTACPVIRGEKWSAAKWIHVGHYSMGNEPSVAIEQQPQKIPKKDSPDGCEDTDDLCYEWAEAGECERNPSFMIGTRARPGKCVKSCSHCEVVTESGAEELHITEKDGTNSRSTFTTVNRKFRY